MIRRVCRRIRADAAAAAAAIAARVDVQDVAILVGLGLITAGVWKMHVPSALIFSGVAIVAFALFGRRLLG